MNDEEVLEAMKWLEEKKFVKGEDGKWRRSMDIVSVDRNDWARLKAEGKNYTGKVVQSMNLAVGLVRLSNGMQGWQCAVEISREQGKVSAAVGEVPEKAFVSPEAAIKMASQLLFVEVWNVVKQLATYAKFTVDYENAEAD